MQTTLLIPCFNEAEGIPQLCDRLRVLLGEMGVDADVELLFVDDGSTDGTADAIRREAEGLTSRIVTHSRNMGLGAALRTGFASSSGEEIVTLDSDCTYDPVQVVDLLQALRRGAGVVTGSPYHPKGEVVSVQGWRLFLSKTLSWMYWLILPRRLYTYTSCFRAYRRDILREIGSTYNDFLAVTDLLVMAILKGIPVEEVPVTLTVRRFGRSKIRTLPVSLSHLRYFLKVIWLRATGTARREVASPPVILQTTSSVDAGKAA